MLISKNKKKCICCKKVRELTDFYPGRNQCKVCCILSAQTYYKNNVEHLYTKKRERIYGITKEEYEERLINQGGVCVVCGNINRGNIKLAIDHDHNTGEIRGLLCTNCNGSLGLAHDNPVLLRKLADYLDGV